MVIFIYNICYFLFAIINIPILLIKGKWQEGFVLRKGVFSPDFVLQLGKKPNIWIHAVSVGEVLASVHLIKEIKLQNPSYRIVCTTVTKTGYTIAKQYLKDEDCVMYAPLDFSWIVKRYIRAIKPKIYISAETEIWPNTYTQLQKAKVPLVIFNGRISDKSFGGYKKLMFMTRQVLKCVECFCMQSQTDQKRIITLGADANRTHVVGNIKFDVQERSDIASINQFGFTSDNRILVAGSTHKGEEEIILKVFIKLVKQFKDLRLVIVPRHVERAEEIKKYVSNVKLNPLKYSDESSQVKRGEDVLIVDQIGHLLEFYKHGTVVFIGKSLIEGGGQNIIEPAIFAKPIVVGPHTSNFKDIVDEFVLEDALKIVRTEEELYVFVEKCLKDASYLESYGRKAKEIVERNKGVAKRTMKYIEQYI